MEHYAGIDVSLERSSVCVVDATGRIIREAKVASEPEALVGFFRQLGVAVTRIGLEAGPLSQWLHAGMRKAGLAATLLETLAALPVMSSTRSRLLLTWVTVVLAWLRMGALCSRTCRMVSVVSSSVRPSTAGSPPRRDASRLRWPAGRGVNRMTLGRGGAAGAAAMDRSGRRPHGQYLRTVQAARAQFSGLCEVARAAGVGRHGAGRIDGIL